MTWRRGGDSHPRCRFTPHNRLAICPVQPLQHLSATTYGRPYGPWRPRGDHEKRRGKDSIIPPTRDVRLPHCELTMGRSLGNKRPTWRFVSSGSSVQSRDVVRFPHARLLRWHASLLSPRAGPLLLRIQLPVACPGDTRRRSTASPARAPSTTSKRMARPCPSRTCETVEMPHQSRM